jgi:hypothetical protein
MGGGLFGINKPQGSGLFGQQPANPGSTQLGGANFGQQPAQQPATPLFG